MFFVVSGFFGWCVFGVVVLEEFEMEFSYVWEVNVVWRSCLVFWVKGFIFY